MFALIFENKVIDIVNKEFPCVKFMEWVECNDTVQIGWFYVEGIFKETLKNLEELLADAKIKKTTEIRAIKEIKLYESIFYMGKYFYASERASANLISSLLLNGDNVTWLDVDGNLVNMTKAEFQGLGIAIKNQRSGIYFIEAQKYKDIKNCITIEEIKAIKW